MYYLYSIDYKRTYKYADDVISFVSFCTSYISLTSHSLYENIHRLYHIIIVLFTVGVRQVGVGFFLYLGPPFLRSCVVFYYCIILYMLSCTWLLKIVFFFQSFKCTIDCTWEATFMNISIVQYTAMHVGVQEQNIKRKWKVDPLQPQYYYQFE